MTPLHYYTSCNERARNVMFSLQYEFFPKWLSSRPQYIRWPRGPELYVYLLSLVILLFSKLLVVRFR